jgi:hypothetical protein
MGWLFILSKPFNRFPLPAQSYKFTGDHAGQHRFISQHHGEKIYAGQIIECGSGFFRCMSKEG